MPTDRPSSAGQIDAPPGAGVGVLSRLAGDERGTASISFLLTLPIFWMVVSIIVQLALMCCAQLVVEHAAQVAARSAMTALPEHRPDDVRRAAHLALAPISPAAPGVDAQGQAAQAALSNRVGPRFGRRVTYAAGASRVAWSPGDDDLSTSAGQELRVDLNYPFLLTVPAAALALGSPRRSVAGVQGRFLELTATRSVRTAPGRDMGAGAKGYLMAGGR